MKSWVFAHPVSGLLLAFLILVGLLLFVRVLLRGGDEVAPETTVVKEVPVSLVRDLALGASSLTVSGVVTSQSEATVRAERSGIARSVNKRLGQGVAAGEVIAQLDNAAERAAVLQASGSVEAAKANLQKVQSGSRTEQRSILETSAQTARTSLETTKQTTVTSLLTAYATVESAIKTTADSFMSNPTSPSPQFSVQTNNFTLANDIENERIALQSLLARQAAAGGSLTATSALNNELDATIAELRTVISFFDKVVVALNGGIPTSSVSATTLSTYVANASAARSALNGTINTLLGAKEALTAKEAAILVADKNLEQGVTGGQPEDVAAAKAAVTQAQGALAGAQANLEKTIIRAPISGTINALDIERGDFVQALSPVVTIANNGTLEVVGYLSGADLAEVRVGAPALVEGFEGVVTRLAPAVDPVTKKAEVRVAISDRTASLTNGSSVVIAFPRSTKAAAPSTRMIIPITALKVAGETYTVLTVEEGVLVARDVELGTLLGDKVVITSGVTLDTPIVIDARGLRVGQNVTIK